MSPKKDSSRIYEMLAKRGLAEPVEPEYDTFSDGTSEDTSADLAEADAVRRFFDEEEASKSQEVIPFTSAQVSSVTEPAEGFWGGGADLSGITDILPDKNAVYDDYADVSEIYRKIGVPLGGVDTVYLLEEYIATLPDSLPPEMRKSIVLKIVSTSGFDFEKLLNDGIDRVTRLNDYSASFAARTDELIAESSAEIEALNRKMDIIKERVSERKNLHKRQFLAIESEAQRLKEVLDFITK